MSVAQLSFERALAADMLLLLLQGAGVHHLH
jgi:hypothetical protein